MSSEDPTTRTDGMNETTERPRHDESARDARDRLVREHGVRDRGGHVFPVTAAA